MAAKEMARKLAADGHVRLSFLAGALVDVGRPAEACPRCGGSMLVQKTVFRTARTIELGSFRARETITVCPARCRHSSGTLVTRRDVEMSMRLPPGGVVGYDLLVAVGLARFLRQRQREEICEEIERNHLIRLSTGGVSHLAGRFLDYLCALHEVRAPDLAAALQTDGGWPLHVDATGEGGRGTLFVAFAGWRRWVLGAWKIPTECRDAILPCLEEVVDRFGPPCAVMRDLGRAMIPAVQGLLDSRGIDVPVLSCHEHFLSDVGEDLLEPGHNALAAAFRTGGTRGLKGELRKLARDLGRKIGDGICAARQALLLWQKDQERAHHLPAGRDGLAVIRGIAQWVLDYEAEGTYGTFPFDRPWLDLYDRVLDAHRAVAVLRSDDRKVSRALARLHRALEPVAADDRCARTAETLRRRAAIFDEFREVLRIVPRSAARRRPRPNRPLTTEESIAELKDVEEGLSQFEARMVDRQRELDPEDDESHVVKEILVHLDRHGDTLFGHVIQLPPEAGGGVRMVDRTNNIEEEFFREMKHRERRRSGRKNLTCEFENLPAGAALAQNLRHEDYVKILCGSLEELPAAFARLDAERGDAIRAGGQPKALRQSRETACETASLPMPDRRIVRNKEMTDRMRRAAASPDRRVG